MNSNSGTIQPLRKWSQNFLTDQNIARKIADALQLEKPAVIIEVGPGKGVLTKFLIPKSDALLCVEIDQKLAEVLPSRLDNPQNLTVIKEDILDWDLEEALQSFSSYHKGIIGNLPYHITSPILFKVLKYSHVFEQAVFTIQKEVAQRICAPPGSKTYGIISVFCQFYAEVKYVFSIPSHLFSPAPKVDSGVIRLQFLKSEENRLLNATLFRELVRHTFGQRRKMLRNTLSILYPASILDKLHLDLTRRPESLSVDEFVDLANQLQTLQMHK